MPQQHGLTPGRYLTLIARPIPENSILEIVRGFSARRRGIDLVVEASLVARLAHEGFDAELGARPLKRHLRRTLEKELTRALLGGELADGAAVTAREGEDGAVALQLDEVTASL